MNNRIYLVSKNKFCLYLAIISHYPCLKPIFLTSFILHELIIGLPADSTDFIREYSDHGPCAYKYQKHSDTNIKLNMSGPIKLAKLISR